LGSAAGERLPFRDGAFASAFSNSVLEHIPPLQEVLDELGRVVRPGGKLVFTVPNPGYLEYLSLRNWPVRLGLPGVGAAYAEWFRVVTRTVNLEWEVGWQARLDHAGFELVRSVRYFPPRALRALEWGHYFGLPSLVARNCRPLDPCAQSPQSRVDGAVRPSVLSGAAGRRWHLHPVRRNPSMTPWCPRPRLNVG
jgi:SAM-dependent methyltransferase